MAKISLEWSPSSKEQKVSTYDRDVKVRSDVLRRNGHWCCTGH
jgi:hypothetical protein